MPHLNLFCAFGRPQGAPPRTFEHAQRESRENIPSVMYIFHDGMAYWLGSLDGTADSPSMFISYALLSVPG